MTDTTFRAECAANPYNGEPFDLNVTAVVADRAEAERIKAWFPKSVGVRATTSGRDGYVWLQVRVRADRVNGGRNEAGIKRYRRFRAVAAEHGIDVVWTAPARNSIRTEAEFEAMIEEEA